jgi:hypothetical protein
MAAMGRLELEMTEVGFVTLPDLDDTVDRAPNVLEFEHAGGHSEAGVTHQTQQVLWVTTSQYLQRNVGFQRPDSLAENRMRDGQERSERPISWKLGPSGPSAPDACCGASGP